MKTKLEVCIDNLAGLDACIKGNADRIELCSSLIHGGLTPETDLMRHASNAAIPVRMMVRPKSGSFHYSSQDLRQMKDDIDMARAFGFEGVVFGATLVNGSIDKNFLELLITHALGLKKQGAIVPGLAPRFSFFNVDRVDKISYDWGKNHAYWPNF